MTALPEAPLAPCILQPLLAKYPHGFYCDDCGEPATALARIWIDLASTTFAPRWALAAACNNHRNDPWFKEYLHD